MGTIFNTGTDKNRTVDADRRYKQVKASIPHEVAAAFKAKCKATKVSMAGELTKLMAAHANAMVANRAKKDMLASRGGRRKRVSELTRELEQIMLAEEQYRDAIPENLQSSIRYENAEQSLQALEEAIGILEEAY